MRKNLVLLVTRLIKNVVLNGKATDLEEKSLASTLYSMFRDFPTVSKQGSGTNDIGKNNTYISQIGKMYTKQNRG